mmetsp:Transcript_32349/g.73954  ORF Transcript_32349/g.73954 Transcript_32349/m.73954 type:complete len:266 (-) Transcript_32349:31-828(-)
MVAQVMARRHNLRLVLFFVLVAHTYWALLAESLADTFLQGPAGPARPEDGARHEVPEAALRRTALLSSVSALAMGTLARTPSAQAAIPTPEEFYVDNGAFIRDPKEVQEAKIKAYEESIEKALKASLPDAAKQALVDLNEIEGLLKEQEVEAARMVLARPNMRQIGIVISGTKFRSTPQGPWEKSCMTDPNCEEVLQDAREALQQLEEWCFTNNVPIFNSMDRRQVMARPEAMEAFEKQKGQLQEPLTHVAEARVPLQKIAGGKY